MLAIAHVHIIYITVCIKCHQVTFALWQPYALMTSKMSFLPPRLQSLVSKFHCHRELTHSIQLQVSMAILCKL